MPRIYDSANDPLDFCKECFPEETEAEEEYGNSSKTGEGPDDRGNCFSYDAEHPDYEGEEYTCQVCNKLLEAEDN